MHSRKQTGNKTYKEAKEIINKGHPPMADKVALIDFDGTLFPFGFLFDFPPPLPGAIEGVKALQKAGYSVWIFTSRLHPEWLKSVDQSESEHIRYIYQIMNKHGIAIEGVTDRKMPAAVYIDDKAYRFENNWDEIVSRVINE